MLVESFDVASVSLFHGSWLTGAAGSLEDASGRGCISAWHSRLSLHRLTAEC